MVALVDALLVLSCCVSMLRFADGKATFSIQILEFKNNAKQRMDGTCCGSTTSQKQQCQKDCSLDFRICLEYFEAPVSLEDPRPYRGPCLYGQFSTGQWGFTHTVYSLGQSKPYDIDVTLPWTRSFAVILEAYDLLQTKEKHLIDRAVHRGIIVPANWAEVNSPWHHVTVSTRISGYTFYIHMQCAKHHYNSTCTKFCNSTKGHYTCDPNGDMICNPGWMGADCSTPICKVGCHSVHGSCSQPGECKCATGWQGAYCDECIKYPGCKHGTCNDSPWTCRCFLNWGGPFCDKDLNYCGRHLPCRNGGVCKNVDSEMKPFSCICPRGYDGERCEKKLDPCSLSPCKRGSCISNGNSYRCECVPGWEGENCDINIDHCKSSPCTNGGTCQDLDQPGFTCICPVDYKGANCHIRSPCGSVCQHARDCTLMPESSGGYECHCQPGWTGKNCDKNINDCVGKCKNNGTCQDLINDYFCECPVGFSGRNCEVNEECASRPCMNNGICKETLGGYHCECPEGFTGLRCETAHSGCNPNPCLNGAYCYNLANEFYCKCTEEFYGKHCEHPRPYCGPGGCEAAVDPCAVSISANWSRAGSVGICGNHGTCVGLGNGEFQCMCDRGFKGKYCQENIDDCDPIPCQNGALCLDGINDFQCVCEEGYDGKRCDRKHVICDPKLCSGHGTCLPTDNTNDFICNCKPGRSGRWCQYSTDKPCDESTCFNGGTCYNDRHVGNGFTCQCPPEWMGTVCHIRRPEYRACYNKHNCQNGGTCADVGSDYNCICKEGFAGKNCEINVNECNPQPCYNGGVCRDLINSFECVCPKGFMGPDCRINTDDCVTFPCAYGATCIDKVNHYECRCPEGRHGLHCEDVIIPAKPKPPSCVFYRRQYDHGDQWLYNCKRCRCHFGKVNCTDEFCGTWSCRNARDLEDKFACKAGEICHTISMPDQSSCFVQPCYPRAVCLNASQPIPIAPLPWAANSGPGCRPNSGILNNHCARLHLRFNKLHVPYGVTVDDVCQALRAMRIFQRLRDKADGQGLGLSCDIYYLDNSVIEVTVSSPIDRLVQMRDIQRPFVHKLVDDIAASLGNMEGNSSVLLGVTEVKVETLLITDNELGPYVIPVVCGMILFIGILCVVLLIVCYQRRKHQLIQKYAPQTEANNVQHSVPPSIGKNRRSLFDTGSPGDMVDKPLRHSHHPTEMDQPSRGFGQLSPADYYRPRGPTSIRGMNVAATAEASGVVV